jgi:hypothetical protein
VDLKWLILFEKRLGTNRRIGWMMAQRISLQFVVIHGGRIIYVHPDSPGKF